MIRRALDTLGILAAIALMAWIRRRSVPVHAVRLDRRRPRRR